jgi:glutathione peroxidase
MISVSMRWMARRFRWHVSKATCCSSSTRRRIADTRPQYKGLESVWRANRDRGLQVLGVPCNQFGGQEPGSTAEIGAFCQKNYGVSFPLTAKSDVKGNAAHPFYVWAAAQAGEGGEPKWNFHKYLIGRDGSFLGWFSSAAKPTGPKITRAVEAALG